MNSKEKLIDIKCRLLYGLSKNHKEFIDENTPLCKLTEEQFNFLRELYLKDGYIIGVHNTSQIYIESFFNTGLFNVTGYNFGKTFSLSNTVTPYGLFAMLIANFKPEQTSIIFMLPIDIINGSKGIFKDLNDGNWGIPPQYIVGAFRDGKIFKNNNYDPNYYDKNSYPIDDIPTIPFRTRQEKVKEVNYCTSLFYEKLNELNNTHISKK